MNEQPAVPARDDPSATCWPARAVRWARALIAIGLALRIERFLANRSLWLDEAYLAESILTYSARDLLTRELMHWQAAPVGFLLLQKLAVTLLGTGEHALRLVPLLAGLASVPLFCRLARRVLPPAGGVLAVLTFALLEPLVYYGAEVKQYALDVVAALAILLAALRALERPGKLAPLAALASTGAIAVFLSHPAIFVLAAAGLALVPSSIRSGPRRALAGVAGTGALWLALFAANYALFLEPLTRHRGLSEYWSSGYPPRGPGALPWLGRALASIYTDFQTMWLPMPDVAVVATLIGVAWFWRHDRRVLPLLTLPVVFALLAAALHRFPFSGRLILFLVPPVLLLMGAGAQAVRDALLPGRRLVPGLLLATVLVPTVGRAVFYAAVPRQREEMKAVLAHVRDGRRPGDAVYVFHLSDVPFRYHRDRFGLGPGRFGLADVPVIAGARFGQPGPTYEQDLSRLRGRGRVWVLLTHARALGGPDEERIFPEILDRWGARLAEHRAKGATVWLYDMGTAGTGQALAGVAKCEGTGQ